MTTPENEVFKKIKEMSARTISPRPIISTNNIARELSLSDIVLVQLLARLKQLKLISYPDMTPASIKLTLLGTVVTK